MWSLLNFSKKNSINISLVLFCFLFREPKWHQWSIYGVSLVLLLYVSNFLRDLLFYFFFTLGQNQTLPKSNNKKVKLWNYICEIIVCSLRQDGDLDMKLIKKVRCFFLTLSWRRPLSYRNGLANPWTGFCMISASVMKGLKALTMRITSTSNLHYSIQIMRLRD